MTEAERIGALLARAGERVVVRVDDPVAAVLQRRDRHRVRLAGSLFLVVLLLIGVTLALVVLSGRTTNGVHPTSSLPGPSSSQWDRYVYGAVVRQDANYFVIGKHHAPVVSYAVTTPAKAYAFLTSISWSDDFYSSLDCHCVPTSHQLEGETGSTSAELSLIPKEAGPVAVVELSGDRFASALVPIGGELCRNPCHLSPITAVVAPVAFLVVNLNDGDLTGGMLATPKGGASSFSLKTLGTVTTWAGPSSFGRRPRGQLEFVYIHQPHTTGQ